MLNPITYTEDVVADFLRYQMTTYGFAEPRLNEQLRQLLSLEETRYTPLMKGPFVSLSRAFRQGATIEALVEEGLLHPHLRALAPHPQVRGHQEAAFRAMAAGRTTLVATGTGSGKTESFLYPIISHALTLRDQHAPEGIAAVIVYPMNALAQDQLKRLRGLLAGSSVSFGMYVGWTPESRAKVRGHRVGPQASRAEWQHAHDAAVAAKDPLPVLPPEERASREEMRLAPPRILLTNVKQLELLLTRQHDIELFENAQLRYLVFDEAHTFAGAVGAESAVLIRRLRAFCGKRPDEVVCVATSATIADPERGVEAGREFASRFFGVPDAQVALVGEAYEADDWAAERAVTGPLPGDLAVQLQTVLDAARGVEGDTPDEGAVRELLAVARSITGQRIGDRGARGTNRGDARPWNESLYDALAANEVVYQLAEALARPRPLAELVDDLAGLVGRPVPEEEILIWLALGSVARRGDRPLLRPVVHVFVRGMAGAVVTFPEDPDADGGPRLWLSADDAARAEAPEQRFPVLTCTTCGQHYLEHHLEDFEFCERLPGGGRTVGADRYWEPNAGEGGGRVVLVDRVVSDDDDDDDGDGPTGSAPGYLCRSCGALHPLARNACLGCSRPGELVRVYVLKQDERTPGALRKCVSCGALGRRHRGTYREPARPTRAVGVSDIHVLAQNMLHRAQRKRLIVFADNRQDAAFQAGWMQDHARRYRLRALMWEHLHEDRRIAIGDLVTRLDEALDADDPLSQALLPEVWSVERKTETSDTHGRERKQFLRMQVLREVATGLRQRIGLEPWGRLAVDYHGLEADGGADAAGAVFVRWADTLGVAPDELADGVRLLLDIARRSGALFDAETRLFTWRFDGGTRVVQRGYVPEMQGMPKGFKLTRDGSDKTFIGQWLAQGLTRPKQIVRAWGLDGDEAATFLTEIWQLLTRELRLFVPVTLGFGNGDAIAGTAGAHQVDADRLLLSRRRGRYRCGTCRRTQLRAGPNAACVQWRCTGTVRPEDEDPDDYDLRVIDEQFFLLRPREHSAQVPSDKRADYENLFKNEESEVVNTLVATPTLELGVDIGSLDAVLMRNVPPLPANYWQRAGRAGRQHRMSVNVTYAHPRSHDRAYFEDPLKLLGGAIVPPRFNLKNGLMVRKHVHASALTVLHRLARVRSGLDEGERERITTVLGACIPSHVKTWLFDDGGNLRSGPYDVTSLGDLTRRHRTAVVDHMRDVFASWPAEDAEHASLAALEGYIDEMADGLREVVRRLEARLGWALAQLARLRALQAGKGTLDPDEVGLRTRAERLVNRLKGRVDRRRQDAEGFDDTYTLAVLAAEGFLPGYGLDAGGVVGSFESPRYSWLKDFDLRRPTAMGLREYVPGNLIYANGYTFTPRTYRFPPDEAAAFAVDAASEAVRERGTSQAVAGIGSATVLTAMPISDCDIPHVSHISDSDETRFQLPVSVFGYLKDRHGGGESMRWGARDVQLRRQQHMRLVNVGASSDVRRGNLGYPICLVCGTSRSPFASDAELTNFRDRHEDRCGRMPGRIGLYADVIADALLVFGMHDKGEAWSVGEALRQGAADVLDMQRDDLQTLVISRSGDDHVDLVLYDPMPGGSGLLDQIVARWGEVWEAARHLVADCPAQCARSCVDCLQNYRNQWAHAFLDRHVARDALLAWGAGLEEGYPVPPRMATLPQADAPVGAPAERLLAMFEAAGFPSPVTEYRIDLARPLNFTLVDFFFADPSGRSDGICVYLDGLSAAIHGNPQQRARDQAIRDALRNMDYEVVTIAASEVSDRDTMAGRLGLIARKLLGKAEADRVRADRSWFPEE